MKINKKKILFLSILVPVIVYWFYTPYPLIYTIFILLCISFFIVNKAVKIVIFEGTGIRLSNGRNFNYLLLGSTTVWKYGNRNNLDGKKLISFAFFQRSLYADFLILKHKFSYVKKYGKVLITIDCQDLSTCSSNKVRFSDILLFHQTMLKSLKVNKFLFRSAAFFPIIVYPIYSIRLLVAKVIYTCSISKVTKKSTEQEEKYLVSMLLEMIDFCLDRELVPEIIFFNYTGERADISKIKTEIKAKRENVNSYLLSSVDQIPEII